jgi:hypothetical protein
MKIRGLISAKIAALFLAQLPSDLVWAAPMSCEHESNKDISAALQLGQSTDEVLVYLKRRGVNHSIFSQDEQRITRWTDSESLRKFGPVHVLILNEFEKGGSLIQKSEILRLDFNKQGRLTKLECKLFFSGL